MWGGAGALWTRTAGLLQMARAAPQTFGVFGARGGGGCGDSFAFLSRRFQCHGLHGRLFYKRRPLQMPRRQPRNERRKWLEMSPQRKGVCERVFVKNQRKPGSGLKRCAYVRLLNRRKLLATIPGMGHNLGVHSVVLVRGGRAHKVPGALYKAVRGVYDLAPVKNRGSSRSKYGVKLTPEKKQAKRRVRLMHEFLFTDVDRINFNALRAATWKDTENRPLLRELAPDEDLVPPTRFNYKWKFIEWKRQQRA